MKNSIYILGIAIISLTSCKKEVPIDYAIINGKITNTSSSNLIISSVHNSKIIDTLTLSLDGSFVDTIQFPKGQYILANDKNRINLYLEKGFNLSITADANDFDKTTTIIGVGAAENNYLKLKKEKNSDFKIDKDLYKLEENAFKEKINKQKTELNTFLKNTKGLSENFLTAQEKDNNYNYLALLSKYENTHKTYTKNRDFEVSYDFLTELNKVEYYIEEDYINHLSYKDLVLQKIRNEVKIESKNSKIPFYVVASKINSEFIKNDILSQQVVWDITHHDPFYPNYYLEEIYALFKATATDKDLITKIDNQYAKLKALTKGKPSPKFVNYENNDGSTTSLDDFKGKYVYIDVWATWCGPCIAEIPALKETEKEYHDKNIEFVSISIDDPNAYDKWKKMILDKELGGIQLIADNKFKSDFIEDYVIKGIPHFILIDPEGSIVIPKAPKPSDPKLKEVLNDLL